MERSGVSLAAVSILVCVLLVFVLILALILVLVLVLILVLVLVIHTRFLRFLSYGLAANIACPAFQDLSLALKIKLASRPARMAAVMPPAAAFSPPVKIPRNPSC